MGEIPYGQTLFAGSGDKRSLYIRIDMLSEAPWATAIFDL
jgi:hypothetical protein